ncbi:DUF2279 domain-containing protein [Sphingobium sp. Sx8-8]|uniref:DUF2279 domain-containing protein n=1 Tax=Sphingobium sp. Sx8-8 TaxID=2933617 RepID=UPI001F584454|nr:DUF2279 domain-containing protein [Sphingobium sp. Sx8-8]
MHLAWAFFLSAILSAGISLIPAAAQVYDQEVIDPSLTLPDPRPIALMESPFDLGTIAASRQEETAPIQGPSEIGIPLPQEPGQDARYRSLGGRIGAAKWESIGLFAYITATQAYWTRKTTHFHFKDEGWFGKNTHNLGIDKLTHAFNTYLLTEFLGARIARKSGDRARAAAPAALLSTGLMLYGEIWDAHKEDSGFSVQDVIFNSSGALFSVLRHTVPGLEEKLDFRLLMMPNSDVYTFKGKRHYEQQRFLLSLELAGFRQLRASPLRFVELQTGYRGKDFTNADRAAGIIPRRDIFFGVGLNIKELFFRNSRSRLGRAIGSGLNYFQLPYTAVYDY